MKIFQVGGAVRDLLLGLKPKDRDWVVIGANQEELLAKGFKKIGRAFPVFLHPETKEEYALARTERKNGEGHLAFDLDFNPKVTLEEDLARRDFTINAIALDQYGKLIDPFCGADDLKKKLLRHITSAFAEDPLRVLRAARFSAKLEFTIASETKELMSNIVASGELDTLSKERIQREFILSMKTIAPNNFFKTLHDCGALSEIIPECDFIELTNSKSIIYKQFNRLNKPSDADYLILLAIFISKLNKKPRHGNFNNLIKRLKFPKIIQQQVSVVTENWQDILNASKLSAESILMLLKRTDAFRRVERLKRILITMQAIFATTSIENDERLSLFLLAHILDNPISNNPSSKNNGWVNRKSPEEIKLDIDKKRIEVINQAQHLFRNRLKLDK